MGKFLWSIGWLLIVVAGILFALSPFVPSAYLDPLKGAMPAGVLAALAGHFLTQSRGISDSTEKRSQFYLDSCVKAYEEARSLLHDNNNERATWIAAGRALVHARALESEVKLEPHQRVLELHKLKYRGFFHDLLSSKPATFFYGASDTSISLTEAAKQSTAPAERKGRHVSSTANELSEKSLYAVWKAAQWPEEYKDPLDKKFLPDERGRLLVLFPGLYEYLDHKEQWASASGQLFERKNGKK